MRWLPPRKRKVPVLPVSGQTHWIATLATVGGISVSFMASRCHRLAFAQAILADNCHTIRAQMRHVADTIPVHNEPVAIVAAFGQPLGVGFKLLFLKSIHKNWRPYRGLTADSHRGSNSLHMMVARPKNWGRRGFRAPGFLACHRLPSQHRTACPRAVLPSKKLVTQGGIEPLKQSADRSFQGLFAAHQLPVRAGALLRGQTRPFATCCLASVPLFLASVEGGAPSPEGSADLRLQPHPTVAPL